MSAETPTVLDMKGATIRCIFYRPWQRLPIEKVGIITDLKVHNGELFMYVEATDGKQKWVSENDFIAYVKAEATTEAVA